MKGFRLFILIFAACVAAVWLVGTWLWRTYGGDVEAEMQRMRADARAFSAEHEQADCAPEAFARLAACDGLLCKIRLPAFTRECLRAARPSPGLCEPVPDSIPLALLWPTTECADMDVEQEVCERILREVATACVAPREQR